MRILKFIVDKQVIKQDPDCDFSGLVPGSSGYLEAEFSFSSEWNDCVKAVDFYSVFGSEYPARLLADGRSCVIPSEALAKKQFKLRVVGVNAEKNIKLITNKLTITQDGGKT